MKGFITENFLIRNQTGEKLFHEILHELPIIDYHNHLNTDLIAKDEEFENITQLWITGDPYKHRAMRICGIPERNITGDASSDREKFFSWAKTVPKTLGNPLFHWSCLELKRFFGINEMLSKDTALTIWNACNNKIKQENFRPLELIKRWKAELLFTSNDLLDNFDSHKEINSKNVGFSMHPSLRGDTIVSFNNSQFKDWKSRLEKQTGIQIQNIDAYKAAIKKKLNEFELSDKATLSDHALDAGFKFQLPSEKKAADLFKNRLQKKTLSKDENILLQSHLLNFLGKEYGAREWIMQLHIGAQRKTSTRLRKIAGPTGGYACIGQPCNIDSLCSFLDSLEKDQSLPKTILYNLNPADNEAIASVTGSFTGDGVSGKVQFGPAWWYNDHYDGLKNHLSVLANYGLLSQFIGMTTDSRSILSLSRHEYFRRVLSNTLGSWAEAGLIPNELPLLEDLAKNIAYKNIKNYLTKTS